LAYSQAVGSIIDLALRRARLLRLALLARLHMHGPEDQRIELLVALRARE